MEDGLEARRRARKVLVGHSASSPKPAKKLAGKTTGEKTQILQSMSLINGEDLVKHLFDEIGPRFKDRSRRLYAAYQDRSEARRRGTRSRSRTGQLISVEAACHLDVMAARIGAQVNE